VTELNPWSPMNLTRRHFLSGMSMGLGAAALGGLSPGGSVLRPLNQSGGIVRPARRVIFLFQSGGPSQLDLFDHKPLLQEQNGTQLPDSVRKGQRLTGMSGNQSSLPLAGAQFDFARHGESGAWVSELMPHTASMVDDLCFIRSMHTDAINHDPAITFFQTGSEIAGRPCMGSWIHYGLGSMNDNLPAFVVLVSANKGGQPLYSRLWGSGFLDAHHQGVQFRSGKDPVLYLTNPEGMPRQVRQDMLTTLSALNDTQFQREHDPLIQSRMAQYELASRMQLSVPEVTDLSDEPEETFAMYGEDARTPGTYAANCLLARRLAERDVRFIQLYHQGWDQHGNLPSAIRTQCKETDQASTALVQDLKQRGMLDDTLVVWGGEFGRTNYSQGMLTATNYGRDHHPRCFTMWMAGGGVQAGMTYGETDDHGYNITSNPVHVHDLQATILHLMGLDHKLLTYHHLGRDFRLTDVHGHVVRDILG
jgi:hypothetical protein